MLNSRYLSYLLRHHPEEAGLTLDEYGWCPVNQLLSNLKITKKELEDIVANNTRYIFSADKKFIKAAHGHSIPIKYTNEEIPSGILYHGTAKKFLPSIRSSGIQKMNREAVHLSESEEAAFKIGMRHAGGNSANTYVLKIDAVQMHEDGFKFYKSEDGVWLVDSVPTKYFKN